MRHLVALTAASLLTAPSTAQQYPTIVGEWYGEQSGPSDCGGPHAVHIDAMSYVDEAYVCSFENVTRDNWTVTWNGSCSDGSSSESVKVVAREEDGSLYMSFNGKPGWSTLRRCTAVERDLLSGESSLQGRLHYAQFGGDTVTAARYWPQEVETISRIHGASALKEKMTVFVAELEGYQFVLASSILSCGTGAHGCPLRVIKDGEMLAEFSACQDVDSHVVTTDGRFLDCDGGPGRSLVELIGRSWPTASR